MAARNAHGHEPWLFYPQDGRWRWWSFRRGWTEVERWQAAFEHGGRPSVDQGPAPQSSPQALCCHLAAIPEATSAAASEATNAARVFDGLLAPRQPEREIVVVCPPAASPPSAEMDRLAVPWLHWCCANLAVLVLEPSREALVGSVLWCRPTILLADLEQERALAAAVRARSRDQVRRAAALLDRLRVLLVAAADRKTAGQAAEPDALWHSWGVDRRLVCSRDTDPPACPSSSDR